MVKSVSFWIYYTPLLFIYLLSFLLVAVIDRAIWRCLTFHHLWGCQWLGIKKLYIGLIPQSFFNIFYQMTFTLCQSVNTPCLSLSCSLELELYVSSYMLLAQTTYHFLHIFTVNVILIIHHLMSIIFTVLNIIFFSFLHPLSSYIVLWRCCCRCRAKGQKQAKLTEIYCARNKSSFSPVYPHRLPICLVWHLCPAVPSCFGSKPFLIQSAGVQASEGHGCACGWRC